MLDKIRKTVEAYKVTNEGVISPMETAELEAQLCYIDKIKDDSNLDYKEKYYNLVNLVARVLPKEKTTEDKQISRVDFIELWEVMKEQMFNGDSEAESTLYGHDVTVHWHGLYCNCSDGAVASNNIIEGIKGVIDEEDDE